MNSKHLDRPIAFQRSFVTVTGSITSALFLSQAVYWSLRCKDHQDGDKWFYKTQAEWEDETGMSRYEQEGARKVLRNLGILKEKRVGIPAKLYFSIDIDALEEKLESATKDAENQQSGMRETSNQACGKPAIRPAENQQSITEITTETTTEITTKSEKPLSRNRDDDVNAVIDHLNSVTGSKYRATTQSHSKEIRGRLAQGHTVADLNTVTDHKAGEWMSDPKMAQYLRPQTLFCASKFDGYLMAARTRVSDPLAGLSAISRKNARNLQGGW